MTRDASFFRPLSGSELPRFAGRSTFMRLPQIEDPAEVDIALVGLPWDSGSTNRAGQRDRRAPQGLTQGAANPATVPATPGSSRAKESDPERRPPDTVGPPGLPRPASPASQ